MAASTEPRSGILYGWSLGESGWNVGMDANLLKIGRFGFHLAVKDRTLATPPGTPAAGDSYIVAATATGAWLGKEGQIAVYDGAAWQFGVPREGWVAWVDNENGLVAHDGSAWTIGVQLTARLVKAMADANKTLTAAEARSQIIEATGVLTALRDVVVPLGAQQWTVFANVTGGFGVRVIGATGTGITIADGKRAIVYADGTNVVRVTADV